MDRQELREKQAPSKERYRAEPQSARIVLRARGTLAAHDIVCSVETGEALGTLGIDMEAPVVYRTLRGGVNVDVSRTVTA